MSSVVFECKNISIEMGGANPNQHELRPASFKGVMRFWWRAINGDLPLKELKNQEDTVFGSTEKKSSFSIRFKKHKFQGIIIPKNHIFEVELLLSSRCNFDIEKFFKIVVLLGGFGKSAKKQYQGKIQILRVKRNKDNWSNYKEPNSLNEISELLGEKFEIKEDKIVSKYFKFNYPMVREIAIKNNLLSTKLETNKIFKRELNG